MKPNGGAVSVTDKAGRSAVLSKTESGIALLQAEVVVSREEEEEEGEIAQTDLVASPTSDPAADVVASLDPVPETDVVASPDPVSAADVVASPDPVPAADVVASPDPVPADDIVASLAAVEGQSSEQNDVSRTVD